MSSDKGITLGELAKKINAKLVGDPNKLITGINTLLRANEDEVSFLSRDGFIKDLKKSNAGAIIISEEKYNKVLRENLGSQIEKSVDKGPDAHHLLALVIHKYYENQFICVDINENGMKLRG